jgi:pantoate--beta-alanine ligase
MRETGFPNGCASAYAPARPKRCLIVASIDSGDSMQTIRSIGALRSAVAQLRHDGGRVALVPTMGALHEGHLTLIRAARAEADHVVASIFVNPTQFGPNEDLDAYPRREAADAALLAAAGTAILWAPDVATMYPDGHATRIRVAGVSDSLCGAARPGHFDGVATIVAKLFNQVAPDVALFGEKDWQQLAVIRAMARDLDFAIRIIGVPTVREADGLALSSRNAYLTAEQRIAAGALPRILNQIATAIAGGTAVAESLAAGEAALIAAGFASVDYLTLADADSLLPADHPRNARLFVAARIGGTRLIDNIPI